MPGVYAALARALGETGEGAPRIRELLAHDIRVQCVGCGIALTAEELEALALDPASAPGSPRLERLRLGYCARNGCDSRFYGLSAGTGMVPWPTVFRRVRELLDGPAAVTATGPLETASVKGRQFPEQWRRMRWAAAGGIVFFALGFWWWRNGARIPGISPSPREFRVVPAADSAPVEPGPRPGPAPTNSTRSFQTR